MENALQRFPPHSPATSTASAVRTTGRARRSVDSMIATQTGSPAAHVLVDLLHQDRVAHDHASKRAQAEQGRA
jgi:hypothetical protein